MAETKSFNVKSNLENTYLFQVYTRQQLSGRGAECVAILHFWNSIENPKYGNLDLSRFDECSAEIRLVFSGSFGSLEGGSAAEQTPRRLLLPEWLEHPEYRAWFFERRRAAILCTGEASPLDSR